MAKRSTGKTAELKIIGQRTSVNNVSDTNVFFDGMPHVGVMSVTWS